MKKKLVIFCFVTSSMVFGMELQEKRVKVSSPRHLHERFSYDSHLADFAKHSELIKRFGGKELSVAGLDFAIQTFVANYQNYVYRNGGDIKHLQHLAQDVKNILYDES